MTELTQATEESCRADQTGPSFLIAKYTERQTTLTGDHENLKEGF